MEFYPRLNQLFERKGPPELVVGRDKAAILKDPMDDNTILKVDDKKASDIITLEDLKKLKSTKSNYKTDLFQYLEDNGYDPATETEDSDLTYGDFWEAQVEKHKQNLKKYNEDKNLDEDRDFSISTELRQFFEEEGKGDEFNEFIDSIPGGEVKIPLDNLFDLMHDVVTSTSSTIHKKFMGYNLTLDKAMQTKWKKDMVEYIKSFSDVDELIDGDVYKNNILKDNTFLSTLFLVKAIGLGRGEILCLYLVKNSKVSGSGESFDLKVGGTKYEIKEYVMSGDCNTVSGCGNRAELRGIRLGTGGKLTRFGFWRNIQESTMKAQKINEQYGDVLESLVGKYFYKVWMNFIDDNFEGNPKAVLGGVAGGELGKERINVLKMWYYLAHEFTSKETGGADDEFTMATLKGPEVSPNTILIEPIKSDELKAGDSVIVKSNEDITEMITELRNLIYVRNPDQLDKDLENIPTQYFEKEGLDKFVVFRRKKVYIADAKDFTFITFSQAGVSLIEKDLIKDDQSAISKRAYDAWKKGIQDAISNSDSETEKESLKDIIKKFSLHDFVIEELNKDFEDLQQHKTSLKSKSKIKEKERREQKKLEKLKAKSNESFYPRLRDMKFLNEGISTYTPRTMEILFHDKESEINGLEFLNSLIGIKEITSHNVYNKKTYLVVVYTRQMINKIIDNFNALNIDYTFINDFVGE